MHGSSNMLSPSSTKLMKQTYHMNWLFEHYHSGAAMNFLFFWGHTESPDAGPGKACLSQWYPAPFVVDGIRYPTAEHWMMAQKAALFGDLALFHAIIQTPSPKEAK